MFNAVAESGADALSPSSVFMDISPGGLANFKEVSKERAISEEAPSPIFQDPTSSAPLSLSNADVMVRTERERTRGRKGEKYKDRGEGYKSKCRVLVDCIVFVHSTLYINVCVCVYVQAKFTIEVIDRGVGIASEHLTSGFVFQKYMQISDRYLAREATGLGIGRYTPDTRTHHPCSSNFSHLTS